MNRRQIWANLGMGPVPLSIIMVLSALAAYGSNAGLVWF